MSGPVLKTYDIRRREEQIIHDFSSDFAGSSLSAIWTRYEGSPTLDGRYWGLMVEDENSVAVALLVYDRQEDRIISQRDLRNIKNPNPDSVTISPLGTYVIVQNEYCEHGAMGTYETPYGLMVYSRDLESARVCSV